MQACVFCKIVSGEIPSYRVWEDENFVAFLDINPVQMGHTLIIPRVHIDSIFDLPVELYSALFVSGRKLAPVIKQVTGATRVGLSVVGIDIPHTHLHLIPINHAGDMDHAKTRATAKEHLADMQSKIKTALGK